MKNMNRLFSIVIILGFTIFGISCAGRMNFRQGHEAMQKKEWDKAVDYFLKALSREPENVECRVSLSNALISASNEHLRRGTLFYEQNRLTSALREFEKSLEFNPENNDARRKKLLVLKKIQETEKKQRRKTEIEKLKDKVEAGKIPTTEIKYKKINFSLEFKRSTDVKQIFKVMQKSSGVNFLYDEAFKSKKITLNMQDVDFLDALENIMIQTNSFYKILDSNTVIIIPDTPSRRREYEELVMKTFFLSNSDPEEMRKSVRELTGMKIISINKNLNSLTVRGTPAEVRLAGKIIRVHDKPKGELFIDIEIIEVNKNRVKEYGIELSSYQVSEVYQPVSGSETAESTASTIRRNMIPHTDSSDYLLTLPYINYKLLKFDSQSRIKARPQLRVVDQEEVKVSLGDKVPIPTTSFVPYNTGGPNQQPITSYQMQDIGINIDITPRLHHDGLITLKMKFELTFITSPGDGRIPPTIGNRSIETIIKLRDNETSVLAGLLRDTERKSMRGFPFISRVPILRDIFSGNKNEIEQTDIILTLTPRIIRFPEIDEEDLGFVWAGTASRPGLKKPTPTLNIKENGKDQEKEKAKNTKKDKRNRTPKNR
jgi:general secretion pathway protein D